jgi:hypothetical protein
MTNKVTLSSVIAQHVSNANQLLDRHGATAGGGKKLVAGLAAAIVVLASALLVGFAPRATADVGLLGPPPVEQDVRAVLTDLYQRTGPEFATVDVQFEGPILVGSPTPHANPPLEPLCVRCGHPDQGISGMYPVMALVRVTVRQDLATSALAPGTTADSTVTHNGTLCPGERLAQYCSAYYFYRDTNANWRVAA